MGLGGEESAGLGNESGDPMDQRMVGEEGSELKALETARNICLLGKNKQGFLNFILEDQAHGVKV